VQKKYFFMLLYRQFASKCVFLHAIVHAICFKMPVKSLNSCQTILHAILQAIYSQFLKKLLVAAKNLSNILLQEFKIRSNISQTINLHKCIQITDILSLFLLHKKYNAIKKSQKAWKFPGNCLYIC
jgi:hypothetical protein